MDRSDVTLERMRSFVRVAERGSLSAVARELGIGQSTVTRHLQELEESVGVPLLSRTTRRVTLTDEGSRYYANCVQILRLTEQAADDERIDLVREGVDIALRLAPLTDSSMKLRALGHSHRLLVAAPSYLARRGTP